MPMIFLQPELFLAQQRLQLQIRHKKQLIEKCPGYLIRLGDMGHYAVDALVQPRLYDNLDTGLAIQIGTSHTLHRVASGWWEVVMNRNDSHAITIIPPPEVSSELSTGI